MRVRSSLLIAISTVANRRNSALLLATTDVATGKWGAISLVATTFRAAGTFAVEHKALKIKPFDSLAPWVICGGVSGVMLGVPFIVHIIQMILHTIQMILHMTQIDMTQIDVGNFPVRIRSVAIERAIETQATGFSISTTAFVTGAYFDIWLKRDDISSS